VLQPRQRVPELDVELVSGGRWRLSDQRPERFTVIVFYRGYHCAVCRGYITELNGLVDAFASLGVTCLVAVSGDSRERATRAVEEWGLDRVAVGFGQPLASMRQWGLWASRAIRDNQPPEYGEPGLFIIRPDGTLYAAALTSMPFMRPRLDEVVSTIRFVNEHDYPARGEF
jgi:peroxiredoxin